MDLVFNDLPFKYEVENIYAANEILNRFISIIAELESKNRKVQLICDESVDNLELISGEKLIKTFNNSLLRKDKRRILIKYFYHKRLLKNDSVFIFKDAGSKICAYASKNHIPVISLLTDDIFDSYVLKGAIQESEATVFNISQVCHIIVHSDLLKIRIYEFNPKHKIGYGWGSPMDLSDDMAQQLLDEALPYDNDEKCLVNTYNGRFYVFRRHFNNCYHGYRHDSLPEKIKRRFD